MSWYLEECLIHPKHSVDVSCPHHRPHHHHRHYCPPPLQMPGFKLEFAWRGCPCSKPTFFRLRLGGTWEIDHPLGCSPLSPLFIDSIACKCCSWTSHGLCDLPPTPALKLLLFTPCGWAQTKKEAGHQRGNNPGCQDSSLTQDTLVPWPLRGSISSFTFSPSKVSWARTPRPQGLCQVLCNCVDRSYKAQIIRTDTIFWAFTMCQTQVLKPSK